MLEEQSGQVLLHLEGSLSKLVSCTLPYEMPAGLTLMEAVASLSVPGKIGLAALVNGKATDFTYILQPGDEVYLLPQISGG